MHVVVVASGELPRGYESAVVATLREADFVIAADGGLLHCETLGVWPDMVVGDLDSAAPELVARARAANVPIQQHPANKDATDLELALDIAVDKGATQVTVIGAFGGRLDHEQATIGLLASERTARLQVGATDGRRSMWVVRTALDLALKPGTLVSIVPVGGGVGSATTTGLRWALNDEHMPFGTTRGVSNMVVEATQRVAIASGVALVIVDYYLG